MPDFRTRDFWLASLAASWRKEPMGDDWRGTRLDWGYLLYMGEYHRVLESIAGYWGEVVNMPDDVPPLIWMKQELAAEKGRLLEQGLEELTGLVNAHPKARIVVMKSPGYVLEAFGGYQYRDISDLDIVVDSSHREAISDALVRLGYIRDDWRCQRIFTRGRIAIEMHLEIIGRKRFWRHLPPDALLSRAHSWPAHPDLYRLADLDELLGLVLHARRHEYSRWLWLRDLAMWWRIRKPDPYQILNLFKELNLQRVAWVVWRGMEKIGWSMPESWNPTIWQAGPRFDCAVRDFWTEFSSYSGLSWPTLVAWWRIEAGEGQGIVASARTVMPWVSKKRIHQLFLARQATKNSIVMGCGG